LIPSPLSPRDGGEGRPPGLDGEGGGGHGGLEGFGLGQTLLPGQAAVLVEILGELQVEGLADAVWRVLHQGAVHGFGAGEESELAAVVWTGVSGAEVEHLRAFDHALLGDCLPTPEAQRDQAHRWPPRLAWSRNGSVESKR
jgi:hypothetical protein